MGLEIITLILIGILFYEKFFRTCKYEFIKSNKMGKYWSHLYTCFHCGASKRTMFNKKDTP